MCRMAAWLGEPRALSWMLHDAPWSLQEQAYRPREMVTGTINVDGTGVAWWDPMEPSAPPLRYVTTATPWADANLGSLAPRLHSHLQLAAVRSASAGIPHGVNNVAPFCHAGHALAHNGFIEGFRTGTARALRHRIDDDLVDAMDAVSDSLTLFMLVLSRLRQEGDLAAAVTRAFSDVAEIVGAHGVGASLNLVMADGTTLLATRGAIGHCTANSLYLQHSDEGTVLASEALDEGPGWQPIPVDTGVVVTMDGVRPFSAVGAIPS